MVASQQHNATLDTARQPDNQSIYGTVLDLRLKDTELGWVQRMDKYVLTLVPAWFNVLGWIALTGAIQFLASKGKSVALMVLVALSLLWLWFYFFVIFNRIRFVGIIPDRWDRTQTWVSIVISTLLAYGSWQLAIYAAALIARVSSP